MNTKIDLKSGLVGLCVGVLVTLAVGAGNSPNEAGKFRLATAPTYAMVIDTETGRVWNANLTSASSVKSTDEEFYLPKVAR